MKKTSHNKTYTLRMEALECRQMLSVMGAGTDDTATDYAQEAVASYNVNNEYASIESSLMSLAAETSTVDTWDGTADISWWTNKTEGQKSFTLMTAEQLAGLAQLVNTGTAFNYGNTIDFHDYSITLATDIDLAGYEWTPIGELGDGKYGTGGSYVHSFRGTFDGDGHTIDNLTITDKFKNGSGLFGHIEDADIGNFKMTNVNITGERYVAAVAAKVIFDHSDNSSIHDVTVEGMNITGRWYTAGIVGYCHGDLDLTNCKVIGTENANTIEGVRYDADYDGVYANTSSPTFNPWTEGNPGEHGGAHIGGIGAYIVGDITITNCTVENVDITGAKRVGGISGSLMESKNDNIFNHTNNKVINVNILAKGDHENENSEVENNTYFVGAMFGADVNAYDFSNTNNVFQNVTVSISDKDGSNVREIVASMVGNVAGEEDLNAPVAQIYDAEDNTYASFLTLEEALNNYDAKSEGKRVVLLADVTLTEDLNIPEGVTLDTNAHTITLNGVELDTDSIITVEDGSLSIGDAKIEITENGLKIDINGTTINSNGGAKLEIAEDGSVQYIAGEGDTITTPDGEVISLIAGQEIKLNAEGQVEEISAVISHSGNYVIFHLGQINADAKYSFQMKKSTASSWTTFSGVTFDENGYATVKVTSSKFSRGVQYDYRILADGEVNVNGVLTVKNAASAPAVTVTSYTSNDDAKVLTITSATKLDLAYNVKVKSAWKATTANSTYVPSVTETVDEDGNYTYVITLSTDVQSLKLTYNTAYTYGDDVLTLASSKKSTTWTLN